MEHGRTFRTRLKWRSLDRANRITSKLVYQTVSEPPLHNSPRTLPSFDDHRPLRVVKEKSKNRPKMGYGKIQEKFAALNVRNYRLPPKTRGTEKARKQKRKRSVRILFAFSWRGGHFKRGSRVGTTHLMELADYIYLNFGRSRRSNFVALAAFHRVKIRKARTVVRLWAWNAF